MSKARSYADGTRFGILDIRDKLWMGSDEGPYIYEDYVIAQVCAQIIEEMAGYGMGRCRAVPWTDAPARLRDDVPVLRGPLAALQRIEGEKDDPAATDSG